MNTCADFCTAAKCDELEARIASLEQTIELLQAAFEAHTNQDVYEGHNFNPSITIDHQFHDNVLLTNLTFDSTNVNAYVDLNSLLISSFDIEIVEQGDNLYDLQMSINNLTESTQFTIKSLESLDLEIRDLGQNLFQIEVGVNDVFVANTLQVLEPEVAVGFFDLGNNQYGLSVQVGTQQAQENIIFNFDDDLTGENQHVVSNLSINGIHQGDYLYLTVADGESEGTATIYLDSTTIINSGGGDDVGCEQTEQKIDDCCAELAQLINNVSIQVSDMQNIITAEIDDTEIAINNKIQAVEDYVTIDISGTINSEYQCEEPTAENNNITSSFTPINYTGIGLAGIHENLKLINTNLDSIFAATCELELDTVTLVASEQEVGRVEGNVLVIHFVTLDNYPKRATGSNKRRIQIPAPKDNFDWEVDFKDIRWEQGNQYAKLKLEGYKQGITGWFKDAASANATFDQLLTLTTATEKGRNIPNHTNPRTDIVEQVSRPYRAFISRETVSGQPETLTKYFPSIDE